jgi:8-oxo-dGTP pyrophosphatase MutT (NUDIX family)
MYMCHENILEIISDQGALKACIRDTLSTRVRRTLPRDNLRESAVLVPLCWTESGPVILVTKRSMSVEHHKGEISFPGGRAEKSDADIFFTALREAEEEIGLNPSHVEILGMLDDHISILGYHITPVVGAIPYPYDFRINSESDILLRVPLAHALSDTVWMAEKTTFLGRDIHIYYLEIEGGVVWGATGRMLKHFADLLSGRTISFSPVSLQAKTWVRDLLTLQAGS